MKTVLEMAREAGFPERRAFSDLSDLYPRLERFAELVRADEREQGQRWFDAVTAQHKQEILAEREACAKVCDGLADMHAKMDQWGSHKTAETLAQAIRARSNT